MRPKKKILLIDAIEDRQSRLRFMLATNGYRVHAVAAAADARDVARMVDPDLIIACWPCEEALLDELHGSYPDRGQLVLAEGLATAPAGFIDAAVLLKGECSSAEILDRARVLSRRKRGPRKGFRPAACSVDLAERRIA